MATNRHENPGLLARAALAAASSRWPSPSRAAAAARRAAAAPRRPRRATRPWWASPRPSGPPTPTPGPRTTTTSRTRGPPRTPTSTRRNVAQAEAGLEVQAPVRRPVRGLCLEPDRPRRRRLHPGPGLGRLRAEPADRRSDVEAPVQVTDAERRPERPRTRLRDALRRDRGLGLRPRCEDRQAALDRTS